MDELLAFNRTVNSFETSNEPVDEWRRMAAGARITTATHCQTSNRTREGRLEADEETSWPVVWRRQAASGDDWIFVAS